MRVSAGFLVTGLSGYTVIQTLPPRLILRVMAIRAASIWRLVSQPASSALRPYSPNCTFVWPRENPGLRLRCCWRSLTRLGEIIHPPPPGGPPPPPPRPPPPPNPPPPPRPPPPQKPP